MLPSRNAPVPSTGRTAVNAAGACAIVKGLFRVSLTGHEPSWLLSQFVDSPGSVKLVPS